MVVSLREGRNDDILLLRGRPMSVVRSEVQKTFLSSSSSFNMGYGGHGGGGGGRRKRVRPDGLLDDKPLSEGTIETVKKMRLPFQFETVDDGSDGLSYDIHKCPSTIPDGYPASWNILDVLGHWNPDDTDVPKQIYQGLCTVDWNDEEQRMVAEAYRIAELPFLIHNHAEIWKTASRWSNYEYLAQLLKSKDYKNEYSDNNHMMYWKLRDHQWSPRGWKPPTEMVKLSFESWYEKAKRLEPLHGKEAAKSEHYYFRLNGEYEGRCDFLYDELPFFVPQKNFFMVDPADQRGINCRFGSKGIIAETHYDFSRNFIMILGGRKRYILAHPNQCKNMELHPIGHPSARHSRINWSDPDDWHSGTNFPNARVNEVVLQAGDALYLPTSWFHFIVSLNMNYQCNARSGITYESQQYITECGF